MNDFDEDFPEEEVDDYANFLEWDDARQEREFQERMGSNIKNAV